MKTIWNRLLNHCALFALFAIPFNGYGDWGPTIDPQRTIIHWNITDTCCTFIPVFTLTGGAAFSSQVGENAQLGPIDSSTYTYTASNTSDSVSMFGVFLGGEILTDDSYTTQLGLAYYQTGNFVVNGTVTQGVDPGSLNTYPYSYTVKSQMLLIESKILLNLSPGTVYHPYLTLGLGESYNVTQNYTVGNPPFLTFERAEPIIRIGSTPMCL